MAAAEAGRKGTYYMCPVLGTLDGSWLGCVVMPGWLPMLLATIVR